MHSVNEMTECKNPCTAHVKANLSCMMHGRPLCTMHIKDKSVCTMHESFKWPCTCARIWACPPLQIESSIAYSKLFIKHTWMQFVPFRPYPCLDLFLVKLKSKHNTDIQEEDQNRKRSKTLANTLWAHFAGTECVFPTRKHSYFSQILKPKGSSGDDNNSLTNIFFLFYEGSFFLSLATYQKQFPNYRLKV